MNLYLLNSYVAAGGRWGLDAKESGVYVLPPREKADENLNVYRGTADAISQNIDFIDKFAPEYVLVLSGDHIYKMNYDEMLAEHKQTECRRNHRSYRSSDERSKPFRYHEYR